MVLVLADARPERIKSSEQRLISELEAITGLVVGVERVSPRLYLSENNSLQLDQAGTDVYFYAADPDSGTILERNTTRVQRYTEIIFNHLHEGHQKYDKIYIVLHMLLYEIEKHSN
jgi:hypothetical protein